MDSIALLFLQKLELLSKEERGILIKSVHWENTPQFITSEAPKDVDKGFIIKPKSE